MIVAAYLTTAFVVAGVGAFYLVRQKFMSHARIMFGMAMLMAVFVAPLQLVLGDLHGLNTFKHQPAKVAAMEGLWETQRGAPLKLFGLPDQETEQTRYALEIPKASSLILTHSLNGEVKGLKDWPREQRPPVASVFWSFRLMVGIGTLMIYTGVSAAVLFLRKRLFDTRWFQWWCMALTPAGFIAVLVGWYVTEDRPPTLHRSRRDDYRRGRFSGRRDPGRPLPAGICGDLPAGLRCRHLLYRAHYFKGSADASAEGVYGARGMNRPPIVGDHVEESGGSHA